jgi:hypothetical protein
MIEIYAAFMIIMAFGSSIPDLASASLVDLFARRQQPDSSRPSLFNFGPLQIAADGPLRVEIREADGLVPSDAQGRPGALTLTPAR